MSKTRTRKMWVLVDPDEDIPAQLYGKIDGGLHVTRPRPAFKWLKPIRVVVTIRAERRAVAAKAGTQG